MEITYTVHNYAGKGIDKTFTVSGNIAKLVMEYEHKQDEIGITILEIAD